MSHPSDQNQDSHKCLSSSVRTLASFMKDPTKSGICGWRINKAVECIKQELAARAKIPTFLIEFAKSNPELLRFGTRYITSVNPFSFSEENGDSFGCRCDLLVEEIRTLHEQCTLRVVASASHPEDVDVPYMIRSVANCVSNLIIPVLEGLSPGNFSRTNSTEAPGSKEMWPSAADDLLPLGVEASIVALGEWVVHSPFFGHTPLSLSSAIARFYPPFAQELFQADREYNLAFVNPIRHLGTTIYKFHEVVLPNAAMRVGQDQFFYASVPVACKFLEHFATYALQPFIKLLAIHREIAGIVVNRLLQIISDVPGMAGACAFLRFINSIFPVKMEQMSGTTEAKSKTNEAESLNEYEQYIQKPDFILLELRESQSLGCLGVSCSPHNANLKLMFCSKCGTVKYCGKNCVKDSWKSIILPHNRLCGKIRALKEAFGSEYWKKILSVESDNDEFMRWRKEKNVDAVVLNEVANTLFILKLASQQNRLGERM